MKLTFSEGSYLVTGGAVGIGAAAAESLVTSGLNVVIADLDVTNGTATAERLASIGPGKAKFVPLDVSDDAGVEAAVAQTVGEFGPLAGALNCAAYLPRNKRVHEITAEHWDKSHSVSLRGMFFCFKHQITAMQPRGSGSVVAISSTAAVAAVPGSSDYVSAKAGVNGLVRAAALDYAADNIRVNGIMPGAILTPGFKQSNAANPNLGGVADLLPIKRIGRPEEVAAGAVWLLSNESSYVTGAVLPIDGGLSAV
ncbi:SDR family oxidoreductase [Rhodococcus fascians]|nr:SDR family oxidoreductase [Rhodococcus fascians]MBY3999451.1 SDR family oxidoreductase [Rhodococcus fascians]MBY4004984.1 SDR family oxidoreductase [Rhodococcus fascians]MBY4010143.1 SDR family oxidoreductase [Rhodococcus fascians]MBY4020191.1 SDR family oxidoreductase [Rhodococcus fascians]